MQRSMWKWLVLVLITLATAACTTGESTTTTLAPAAPTTTRQDGPTSADTSEEITTSTAETPQPITTDPFEPIATVFIAALGDALAGTSYADAPFEDPEVFIATGQLFCELLDQGANPEDLITDYVTELTGVPFEQADEEALVLAGSVLGVSVEVLCPHHRPLLEGDS
jgi:hypothetical protein